jgi:hypothetical protein
MSETFRAHRGGWVTLDNSAVNDERLSFRARGLLAYLLGRPPGWAFAADRIAKVSPREGREAVLSALTELEAAGYVRRSRIRSACGQVRTITEVAATPDLMPAPEWAQPTPAQPDPVQPDPARPTPKSVPEVVNPEVVKTEKSPGAPRRNLPGASPRRSTRATLAQPGKPPTPEYLAARAAVFANRRTTS